MRLITNENLLRKLDAISKGKALVEKRSLLIEMIDKKEYVKSLEQVLQNIKYIDRKVYDELVNSFLSKCWENVHSLLMEVETEILNRP